MIFVIWDVIGKLPKWGNKVSSSSESLASRLPLLAMQKLVEKWVLSVQSGKLWTVMAKVLEEHKCKDNDRPMGLGLLDVGRCKDKSKISRMKKKDSKMEPGQLLKEDDLYDFVLEANVWSCIKVSLFFFTVSDEGAMVGGDD